MLPKPDSDLVNDAHAIVHILEVVAGVRWAPWETLAYDPSLTTYYGESGFLCAEVATLLFHLTEDDYTVVGADRRYRWDEFPGWVHDWYRREHAWEFGSAVRV